MTLTGAAQVYAVIVVVSSAVNAMEPPQKPRGLYRWFYKFAKQVTASAVPFVEQTFHLPMIPSVTSPDQEQTTSLGKTTKL